MWGFCTKIVFYVAQGQREFYAFCHLIDNKIVEVERKNNENGFK